MKFALVNGQRLEAQPKLSGNCPACDHPMVAKCGERRVRHWAHQASRTCDPWWENETEWHRSWKDQFPVNWQEVVHHAENGEKHIADVKTHRGWVIELQHSYINPEERRSRDAFYEKLVWVVNGARRKTDRAQFTKALEASAAIGPHMRRVPPDKCGLLREWAGSPAPIFFDFGNGPTLWWLLAKGPDEPAYVAPFSRAEFIEIHSGGETRGFDEFVKDLSKLVADYESHLRVQALKRASQPLPGFRQYLVRRDRLRRRF